MFKSLFRRWAVTASLAIATVFMTGCGERVQVPPSFSGKIMTQNGYQKGMLGASAFRLDACLNYCDKLVLLDKSDKAVSESIDIFMPEDKLVISVSINTALAVNPLKQDALFTSIPPTETPDKEDGNTMTIAWKTIYDTYAKQIITSESREFLSKYSIAYLSSNLEAVTTLLRNHLTQVINARTPFVVRYAGLSNVKYPQIIITSQENTATRREQIQTEEAQLQISKVKLQRELQEAQLTRQIEIEKAQTAAAGNRAEAETITPALLERQRLDNQRAWIEKWNGALPGEVTADTFGRFYQPTK